MKKNIMPAIFFSMTLISFNQSFAGPWDWVKDKMNSLWLTYERWNIPRPRLVGHEMTDLNDKKFEQFRYDISRDSNAVKNLRKKLHIAGVYVSDTSNLGFYKEYLQKIPMSSEYIQNGFDLNVDNSINACMARLFNDTINRKDIRNIIDTFRQLLWELEAGLPKEFDQDETGEIFIQFVRKMLGSGIKKVASNEQRNVPQDFMSIFIQGVLEDPDMSPNITGQNIERYLDFWKLNSLRFRNNKGLQAAIDRVLEQYGRK